MRLYLDDMEELAVDYLKFELMGNSGIWFNGFLGLVCEFSRLCFILKQICGALLS